MKKSLCLVAGLLALNLTPVFSQSVPTPPPPMSAPQLSPPPSGNFQQRLQSIIQQDSPQGQPPASPLPALTKFNLDFPGGTPAELVKAIEKATGKPLNTIIPTEDADIQLPPLKMNDVVVPQLFAALERASEKTVAIANSRFPGSTYSTYTSSYIFNTTDRPSSDTSIWYFHANKPVLPPVVSTEKVGRFFSLSPYLDRGFTVDDITTAIQTGWKMAGVTSPPELSYHKETKMLITFGEPNQLQTIQEVLSTLPQTQHSLPGMEYHMKQLQTQVDQLTKKTSSPPAASPAEKSGK